MAFASTEGVSIEQALLRAKLSAAKVDLLTDSNLVDTAAKAKKVPFSSGALDFLGIDFKFLKDTAIPIAKRLPFVKKKVAGVIAKADPILKGIQQVRSTIDGIANGSNFTEGANDIKTAGPIGQATEAFAIVDTHLADIEAKLTDATDIAARLSTLGSGSVSDFWTPGTMSSSVASFTGDPKELANVTEENISEENFLPLIIGAISAVSGVVDIVQKLVK